MADYGLRPATGQDAAAIALIYNQGIEDRLATLETELRAADERRQWLSARSPRHPVIVAETTEPTEPETASNRPPPVGAGHAARVTMAEFGEVELRVAEVVAAEAVPKSKKLLKLTVSLGSEQRTIVAGIAQHYAPADLVGKKVVIVANLEPATLMGVQSQGMVLAGSTEGDGALAVLTLDRDLPPGARVR